MELDTPVVEGKSVGGTKGKVTNETNAECALAAATGESGPAASGRTLKYGIEVAAQIRSNSPHFKVGETMHFTSTVRALHVV